MTDVSWAETQNNNNILKKYERVEPQVQFIFGYVRREQIYIYVYSAAAGHVSFLSHF